MQNNLILLKAKLVAILTVAVTYTEITMKNCKNQCLTVEKFQNNYI